MAAMKKKLIWALGIVICLVSACVKPGSSSDTTCNYTDSPVVAPANEIDSVKKYLNLHSISATQHSSGFFYTINPQGTGLAISNLCSILTVRYNGRLTNGSVFDSTTAGNTSAFRLGEVITGWQKGLPLISKGGKITLYIPPTLGFGSTDRKNNAGVVIIPANSIVIFDVELVDIAN